jgi:hypothetical protein
MSEGLKPEQLGTRLNNEAKTQKALKRGSFEVTRNESHTVVQWSDDQRVERFLVKEPVNDRELMGTVRDVFFRLKRRLERSNTTSAS